MIDMPLEELKKYKGKNPRPRDFDEYWQNGLAEVGRTAAAVELRPARFALNGFECYDLFYTGVKNARIHAKLIKPANAENLPIALHFHGYTGRAYDWNEYVAYAAAGFSVFAMDCRGQAGLSQDVGTGGTTLNGHIIRGLSEGKEHLLFRHVILDTVQLARVAMALPFTDATRLCAFGASQGGALAMACAALAPEISQLASMYPFLCDYKRVLELNLTTPAYRELKEYLRAFDATYEHIDETLTILGYIDIVNLADRIQGETLLAVTLDDDTCPPSTVFAAYNHIRAKKDVRIYPHHGHEPLPDFWDEVIQKFQSKLCC